ncbi:MAG: PLP-dependent aminotransferase family protein [Cyclobacteriaceae bacterium]
MWKLNIKAGKKTKHDALVEYISKLIDSGKLKPGELLPTQRYISSSMQVSIGTVIKAFTELEKRGYVVGEVGRGTFVSDYKYLSSSTPGDQINLGNYESPDFTTIPAFRALQSGVSEVIRESELYFKIGYIDPSGATEHKEAMVEWLQLAGLKTEVDKILICGGAHHGTFISVKVLCEKGESLMVEEMSTLNIRDVCNFLDVQMLPVRMDNDGIIPEDFELVAKTKKAKALYINPTLQNPTCAVMSLKRKQQIVKIAEKYKVTIIEDAVSDLLIDTPVTPIINLYPDNTIYVSSFSKTISPGIRVGIVNANKTLIKKLDFASRATIWMNSPLLNEIATNLVQSGKAKTMLLGKKQAIKQRQAVFQKIFKDFEYVSHLNAFHAWVKLPDHWTYIEFIRETERRNIVIRTSDMFYVGNDMPPNYFRIGLGSPHTIEDLTKGLETIAELMRGQPSDSVNF